MTVWQCSVCKYIHKGKNPPEKCPVCGVPARKFKEIDEASIPPKPGTKKPAKKKIIAEASMFEKTKQLLIKHHMHPISVHTPNGIMPLILLLFTAAWLADYNLLAKAGFINLIFAILVLPFVIFTGVLEWQKKYKSALTNTFKIKISAAIITTLLSIVSFAWYLINPEVLSSSNAWIFVLINVLIVTAVGVAGHIGGKLVFKD